MTIRVEQHEKSNGTTKAPALAPVTPLPAEMEALSDLEREVVSWHDRGGALYLTGPIEDDTWVALIDLFLMPRVLSSGGKVIIAGAPTWRLEADGPIPRLIRDTAALDKAGAKIVLLPTRQANVTIRSLLWLYQTGVSEVWLFEASHWRRHTVEMLLADAMYARKIKRLVSALFPSMCVNESLAKHQMANWMRRRRGLDEDDNERLVAHNRGLSPKSSAQEHWTDWIVDDNASYEYPGVPDGRPIQSVQYIGSLFPGGAERQLCNVAIGLHHRGYDSWVRTQHELDGSEGHYNSLLQSEDVEAGPGGSSPPTPDATSLIRWDLVAATPSEIRPYVAKLAIDLAVRKPDIVHAWLDHPNIIAGLAGLAANVPCILLSTRNYNPTHFPRFNHPFLQWYRILAKSKRVHWLANSHAGAASYAEFVDIPVERFHVVMNGLFQTHFDRPDDEQKRAARRALGLPEDAPVVAVINRLDEEKQPLLMLKVVTLLRKTIPDLRVVVAGMGPMEAEIRDVISRRGLDDCVRLLGRVKDVTPVMSAADVLLMTSRYEGCPNVALEAQHVGLPVVATDAGGTADAVIHGQTGFISSVDDPVGLVMGLQDVLTNKQLRDEMGEAAQAFVDQCFALDQMVDLTTQVYDLMLTGEDEKRRCVTPKPALATATTETKTQVDFSATAESMPSPTIVQSTSHVGK